MNRPSGSALNAKRPVSSVVVLRPPPTSLPPDRLTRALRAGWPDPATTTTPEMLPFPTATGAPGAFGSRGAWPWAWPCCGRASRGAAGGPWGAWGAANDAAVVVAPTSPASHRDDSRILNER